MNLPKELKYTKTHEWVKFEGDTALVGITDRAQQELGDIVYVSPVDAESDVAAGDTIADIESIKAVSEIYSPVEGRVLEVNEELADSPELINEAPYDSWIVKIGDIADKPELLTAEEYAALEE